MTLNFLSRRLSTSSTLPFCFSGQLSRNVFCGRNNNDSSWTKMLSGVSSRGNNQNMISKTCLFIQRGEGLIFISKNSVSSSSSCFIGTKNQIINETAARNNTNNENDPEEDFTKSHVVYEGGLSGQLKRVKLFSMITSAMGMSMQPMILNSPDTHLAATIAVLSMVGFFTYGTPFLIHQLAKKYVTEIIYNPEDSTYTAVRYTFFLRRNEVCALVLFYHYISSCKLSDCMSKDIG